MSSLVTGVHLYGVYWVLPYMSYRPVQNDTMLEVFRIFKVL